MKIERLKSKSVSTALLTADSEARGTVSVSAAPLGGALRAGVAGPISPGRGGGAGRVGELDTMRT